MLVCNVSLRPPRSAIAAEIVEAGEALDAATTGTVVFATLVDDPAAVLDFVDAYLGQIMVEAASAGDAVDGSIPAVLSADVVETVAAGDTPDATTAVAYATFDSAVFAGGTSGSIALSNGNLTVTKTTTPGSGAIGSTAVKSTGKYYFEITNTTKSSGTSHQLGLSSTTSAVDLSSGINCVSAAPAGNTFINSNNTDQGKNLGTAASGNVYGFAVDLTARLAWIRRAGGNWNGDATANPATGTGGVVVGSGSFAPAAYLSSATFIDSVTGNFGATAFTGTVPSGFTAGWPG